LFGVSISIWVFNRFSIYHCETFPYVPQRFFVEVNRTECCRTILSFAALIGLILKRLYCSDLIDRSPAGSFNLLLTLDLLL
jgi:hypothetical protein